MRAPRLGAAALVTAIGLLIFGALAFPNPWLFLMLMQRQFVRGMTAGALKES